MPLFRGVGERIAERLRALGYWRLDGKPNVRKFCEDKRYDKTTVYYWLADRSTPTKELERLARDLKTTPAFLIFGHEEAETTPSGRRRKPRRPVPIAGGSGQAEPRPVVAEPDQVRLIGSYARRRHVRVTAAAAGFRRRLAARAA